MQFFFPENEGASEKKKKKKKLLALCCGSILLKCLTLSLHKHKTQYHCVNSIGYSHTLSIPQGIKLYDQFMQKSMVHSTYFFLQLDNLQVGRKP